jgi:hypothetical protein
MDSTYPPEAWRRLGKVLEKRRGQLGYGFRQRGKFLRERGGLMSPKTLARLERGERGDYPDSTIAAFETLYGYQPGSLEAILRGEEPVPVASRPEPQQRPMTEIMAWTAARMTERGKSLGEVEALFRYLGWDSDEHMRAPAAIDSREAQIIGAELGLNAREVFVQSGLLGAGDLDARGPQPPNVRGRPEDEQWGQTRRA